jgi:hypothetical protein
MIIVMFSTVAGSAELSAGIYSHITKTFARGPVLKIFGLVWLSASVLADGFITISMLYHLEKRRSDGDGFFSNHAISRIVRLTIETNLLTTTVAIISLVLITVAPNKDWSTCTTAIIGKLYANALLASLNNRIAIRRGAERKAAIRSPDLSLTTNGTRSKGPSDFMNFQFDQPPSAVRLMPSRETVRGSRESEGREEFLDIA